MVIGFTKEHTVELLLLETIILAPEEAKDEVDEDLDTVEYRFKECLKTGGKVLDLSNLELEYLPKSIPSTVENLFCSDNNLKTLDGVQNLPSLKVIDCSSLKISSIFFVSGGRTTVILLDESSFVWEATLFLLLMKSVLL